jgi:hypothetical protein
MAFCVQHATQIANELALLFTIEETMDTIALARCGRNRTVVGRSNGGRAIGDRESWPVRCGREEADCSITYRFGGSTNNDLRLLFMQKPPPRKNAVCDGCHENAPLLMPVGVMPGWPIVVWEMLCGECRTAMRVSRHWDRHCVPAYILEHSSRREDRERYAEYVETTIP